MSEQPKGKKKWKTHPSDNPVWVTQISINITRGKISTELEVYNLYGIGAQREVKDARA